MSDALALVEITAFGVVLICTIGLWTMDFSDRVDTAGNVLTIALAAGLLVIGACEITLKWS